MAAEFAAGHGLSDVEIITADARRTGLPAGSFDLVHARTLLVNLPDPADVAAEMMRLARPGGWVASMEPDTEHALCYPPHPAFHRLCDIFTVVFGRNGAGEARSGGSSGAQSGPGGRSMTAGRPHRTATAGSR